MTLNLRAYNQDGFTDGSIQVFIRHNVPVIAEGQTRNVAIDVAPGTGFGSPLHASTGTSNWAITGGNELGLFDINNTGQMLTVRWLDTGLPTRDVVSITVQVTAYNEAGASNPTDVVVNISRFDVTRCPHIPPNQVRFVSAAANPPNDVGDPIYMPGINAIWIDSAQVVTGNGGDLSSAFTIDTDSQLGQVEVIRPLRNFVDTTTITRVDLTLSGYADNTGNTTGSCPTDITQTVIIFILPADAGVDCAEDPNDPSCPSQTSDFSGFIPDASLLNCIRETLGLVGSQPITADLVNGLTRLDCFCRESTTAPDNGIFDLTGIQFFTSLQYLNLSSNFISDVRPLSGLTQLQYLNMSGNTVTDLDDASPLDGLTMLAHLDLSDNQIQGMSALSTLPNLSFLSLRNNRICEIGSLAANPSVGEGDTIHLEGNHLVSQQSLEDVGVIQSRGPVFLSFQDQTDNCPAPTLVPVRFVNWPEHTVLEFSGMLSNRALPPCNN
ncbi:leucine-rich repeat domain-containing protein [Acanthopleuribacter pedis]|uniref:Leucine-rich repeat domain-containing protein n=1 Tax=Acanthopleuribacter pedis TaxID=442870 RepID=A0A8J7QA47_9BACT|nr:leucine-rich repeat domain-containing protein [Acanthopleuribacter pedis]